MPRTRDGAPHKFNDYPIAERTFPDNGCTRITDGRKKKKKKA